MRGVFQATIVDSLGNIVPNCNVEVLTEDEGELVQLYDSIEEGEILGNPLTADEDGFQRFYAESGVYRIRAYLGSFERVWRHVILGIGPISAEFDEFLTAAQAQIDAAVSLAEAAADTANAAASELVDSGSFTATLSGMTATTQGTINWTRSGSQITLWASDGIAGTSNSTAAMVLSGLPSEIQPADRKYVVCAPIYDNSVGTHLAVALVNSSTVTFNLIDSSSSRATQVSAFTGSGTKGLAQNFSLTYNKG